MSKAFYHDFKLGILGGGQLGRMLIQSCVDFNIDTFILDPDEDCPCAALTPNYKSGSLTNYDDVYQFGKDLDMVTIEIENVNVEALFALEKEGVKVFPQPSVIQLIQDKRTQKQFYKDNNIPTADFVLTENKAEVEAQIHRFPAVQKLGKSGYDGRGVQVLNSAEDLKSAFDAPSLIEKKIDFKKEISVITARDQEGNIAVFPTVELVFDPEANLVEYLIAPALSDPAILEKATAIAHNLTNKLGIVGLLAVEMFETHEGELLVNEVAPRPHNSGHHTIKGTQTSQFEQHLRAIMGLPLGSTMTKKQAAMVNILGEEGKSGIVNYEGIEDILKIEGVSINLYGKKFTKPNRKMGHITIIDDNLDHLKEKIKAVKSTIKATI